MATVIPCADIEVEANRLLQIFKSCYTLTATDLDDLVNLSYSSSLCGVEEITPPAAIDQNNIVKYKFTQTGIVNIPDLVTAINTQSSFTIGQTEIVIFIHNYESGGVTTNSFTTTLIQEDWLFKLGKGTYGAGETQVTAEDFYLLNTTEEISLPADPGATLAPKVVNLYADLVVGGLMTTPWTVVNGYASAFTIIDSQDTYFRVYPTAPGDSRQPYNLYRFVGVAGSYGTGGDISTSGDFILVHQHLGGNTNTSVLKGVTIREIVVPGVVDPESVTYTTVSEAVNGSLSKNINTGDNEIVIFLIDTIVRIEASGDKSVSLKSQKWAWNKGAQDDINVGSTDSDFTLLDTYNTVTASTTITTPSVPAEIYTVTASSVATIADAITAINLLTGGDRVVFNNNLVLIKVAVNNDGSQYKIWKFTGAVTGNGIYGVAGLVPVVGDFDPTPIIDSTVGPVSILSAINITFDDTYSDLSAANVQEAIDNLKSRVATLTERDALVTNGIAKEGQLCYVEANQTLYVLQGATNSDWEIVIITGTSFKTIITGLPSTDSTLDAYRTGNTGFGEETPLEKVDIVGSFKTDFVYSNGVIARTAFGGLNINSENGYPASGLKGILSMVYPAPGVDEDTAAMSSQFLQADASGIGSVNLITLLGTQTNDALRYASFRSAKSESNNLTYFAGLDTLSPTAITGKATRSWLRNYEKGLSSGFDKEPYVLFKLDNVTDGVVQDSYMTPHLFSIGANMFQLRGFGVGNRLTGYTGTDTSDRTGTAATTVGAATYNLQVTSDGNLIERALYPDDVITKTTSATSAGTDFTITNLMRTVIAADTGGTGVFNLVLPTAIGIAGQRFLIKNTGAGIKTVLFSLGQSADGATTKALNQYDTFEIESDGANYIIIYNFNDFSFTKTYWFDASDTATTATPITHGAGATNTYLTNNAAGTNTTSHNPSSNPTLWDTSTNKFDFTSLKIGDTVEFRIDINLTNGAAQEVDLFMSIAEGTAAPYELNMNHAYYKTASTLANDTVLFRIYIGDENTRTGGARFRFASADAATIVVNGWFYQITEV